MDETALVQAARAGDKGAFGVLIERYRNMVRRITRRMIADPDAAHDLEQEAMLQAFLSLENLQRDERFGSWLYGVTLNVCRMYLRSHAAHVLSFEDLVGGMYDEASTEDVVERLEMRRVVLRAVEQLSAFNRAAVLLFYYEGFNVGEVAQQLGISVTAVKGRLHKARSQLRKILSEGAAKMIPVKVADVVSRGIENDEHGQRVHYQIVLASETARRAFIIWIGEFEAQIIALKLNNQATPRPMTQVFIARLLEASGAKVESVEISALKDDVYYANVRLRTAAGIQEVDARPSDAIALALFNDVPIYASEEIIAKVGFDIPEGHAPSKGGLAEMLAAFEERSKADVQYLQQGREKSEAQKAHEGAEEAQRILAKSFKAG